MTLRELIDTLIGAELIAGPDAKVMNERGCIEIKGVVSVGTNQPVDGKDRPGFVYLRFKEVI